ncbi:MAG TPA: futalosine hydrolase [Flavisolibacter sp.]|jgi:futalosine hydrolase
MSILLCAATELEIRPTAEFLGNKGLPVEVVVTGVGLAAAVYRITRAALERKPSMMIQAGVAGTLDQKLELGQTVAVRSEIIGDEGVDENGRFRSLFELGLVGPDEFPYAGRKLVNEGPLIGQSGLPLVDGVTVNEISTNRNRIEYYRSLGASSESLEGAGLHYVALMENIPFLQLRSFSNFIGERDKSKWMMAEAIANLNLHLQKLIKTLT